MARERRSQSAIVGAVIIALIMFASLLTALYIMNEYGSYAKTSYEKSTIMAQALELQRSTVATFSYNSSTGRVEITVSSGFPYSYEIYAVILVLSNGQVEVLGPGSYPGSLSVVTPYGSQDWLPASAPAGGGLTIYVYTRQDVKAVSLVVQSGNAVTSVPAVSFTTQGTYYSSPPSTPPNTNSTGNNYVGSTLLGRKVTCQVNITLYNPAPLAVTDFTINLTINLTNYLVRLCENFTSAPSGALVPLSNLIFAYKTSKGLEPMYTWIEAYNSSVADVWVRVPPTLIIYPHSYQTIYMLFLNTSLLGSGYLGVNSYYTGDPSYDNIGDVMARGLLVQVYNDTSSPPSIFVNSAGMQDALWNMSQSGCTLVSPMSLFSWLYQLPISNVAENFSTNYLWCINLGEEWPLPQSANGTFSTVLASPINSGYQNYANVIVGYGGQIQGADVLFNYSSEPNGTTDWPGGVSPLTGNFVMKAVGWFSISQWPSSNGGGANYLAVSADDYGAVLISPSVVTWNVLSYTDWIPGVPGSQLRFYDSNASAWGSEVESQYGYYSIVDYPPYEYAVNTAEAPLTATNFTGTGHLGDYRVVTVYAQVNPGNSSGFVPYDADSYMAVFLFHGNGNSKPSPQAFPAGDFAWYSPMYPQDGVMPYLYCSVPDLLVLPGQPLLPTPPGAPYQSAQGYGWIVA